MAAMITNLFLNPATTATTPDTFFDVCLNPPKAHDRPYLLPVLALDTIFGHALPTSPECKSTCKHESQKLSSQQRTSPDAAHKNTY